MRKRPPTEAALIHLALEPFDDLPQVVHIVLNDLSNHVITSRTRERPNRWSWEIRRKSQPLGIKMTGDGFQSEMAAQFAGKRTLAEFLDDVLKEEKRK